MIVPGLLPKEQAPILILASQLAVMSFVRAPIDLRQTCGEEAKSRSASRETAQA